MKMGNRADSRGGFTSAAWLIAALFGVGCSRAGPVETGASAPADAQAPAVTPAPPDAQAPADVRAPAGGDATSAPPPAPGGDNYLQRVVPIFWLTMDGA